MDADSERAVFAKCFIIQFSIVLSHLYDFRHIIPHAPNSLLVAFILHVHHLDGSHLA